MEKIAAAGLDEVGGFSCGKITSVRIPLPHLVVGVGAVGFVVEQSLR